MRLSLVAVASIIASSALALPFPRLTDVENDVGLVPRAGPGGDDGLPPNFPGGSGTRKRRRQDSDDESMSEDHRRGPRMRQSYLRRTADPISPSSPEQDDSGMGSGEAGSSSQTTRGPPPLASPTVVRQTIPRRFEMGVEAPLPGPGQLGPPPPYSPGPQGAHVPLRQMIPLPRRAGAVNRSIHPQQQITQQAAVYQQLQALVAQRQALAAQQQQLAQMASHRPPGAGVPPPVYHHIGAPHVPRARPNAAAAAAGPGPGPSRAPGRYISPQQQSATVVVRHTYSVSPRPPSLVQQAGGHPPHLARQLGLPGHVIQQHPGQSPPNSRIITYPPQLIPYRNTQPPFIQQPQQRFTPQRQIAPPQQRYLVQNSGPWTSAPLQNAPQQPPPQQQQQRTAYRPGVSAPVQEAPAPESAVRQPTPPALRRPTELDAADLTRRLQDLQGNQAPPPSPVGSPSPVSSPELEYIADPRQSRGSGGGGGGDLALASTSANPEATRRVPLRRASTGSPGFSDSGLGTDTDTGVGTGNESAYGPGNTTTDMESSERDTPPFRARYRL